MKNLSKQQEIDILDKAIDSLGSDSYLGPWLKSVRAEVNALMRSDICPDAMDVSISASRDAASKIKTEAVAEGERIVQSASDNAKRIVQTASMTIEHQRSLALIALREATDKVSKI